MRGLYGFLDLLTGYQGAAVLTAAWRLGVFGLLADEALTSEEVASRLRADPRSVDALLGALASLGAIERDGGRYRSSAFAREHLREGAELGLVIEKEAVFARAWLELESVVRTGRPVLAPWPERLRTEPERARSFLEALAVLARLTGPDVASLAELRTDGRILDVGGGIGPYTRALVEAGRTVVLVELPVVAVWARESLADLLGDRCEVVAADVVAEGLPPVLEGSARALVSHVLHDLEPASCVRLLDAVRRALAPGGVVVVNEFARDAAPGTFGPFFDVMMRVETGGSAYSVKELLGFLAEAGFVGPRRLEADPPITLLAATRP